MRWLWAWKCSHRRLSFPVNTSHERMPHVTCLDCGREFWYDWTRMRRGKERDRLALGSKAANPTRAA